MKAELLYNPRFSDNSSKEFISNADLHMKVIR
jgi:hypothetical protein